MTLAQLLNRPCWVTLRSASASTDIYGNEIPTTRVVETLCEIQQRRRQEDDDQGEVSESDWLGIFPAGTQLDTASSVSVEGLGTFELIGAPWPARNPRTQVESHVEATLRRTAGAQEGS